MSSINLYFNCHAQKCIAVTCNYGANCDKTREWANRLNLAPIFQGILRGWEQGCIENPENRRHNFACDAPISKRINGCWIELDFQVVGIRMGPLLMALIGELTLSCQQIAEDFKQACFSH